MDKSERVSKFSKINPVAFKTGNTDHEGTGRSLPDKNEEEGEDGDEIGNNVRTERERYPLSNKLFDDGNREATATEFLTKLEC